MNLSTYVKTIRKSLKMSQRRFSVEIGEPRDNIANWEVGRANPPAVKLLVLQELAENKGIDIVALRRQVLFPDDIRS